MNERALCWISILSDIINLLFGCLFISQLIFKFFEASRQSINIKRSIKYITISFFSVSTIVPLAWIAFRLESCPFEPFNTLPQFDKDITVLALIIALVVHKVIFHIYMLLRLHLTFKNTVHSMTYTTVIIFCVFLFIEILCQLSYDLNQVYGYHHYLSWTIYVYMGIDLILSLSLIILFQRKLFKMIFMSSQSSDAAACFKFSGAGPEWENHGYNQFSRQVILIRTITKQTLLCVIAIWSRIILNVFILLDETVVTVVYNDIHGLDIFRKILSVMVICLQILCIYLSYHFSESTYNCCCASCHKSYQQRIEKRAERQLERDVSSSFSNGYYKL